MNNIAQNLALVKNYLEQKRREMERHITTLRREDPFSDTTRLSDNAAVDTDAREGMGHERVEALKEELTNQLAKVKKALAKIGIGKYGICDNCGKEIEPERLKAFPMAEYCLTCEKTFESKKQS